MFRLGKSGKNAIISPEPDKPDRYRCVKRQRFIPLALVSIITLAGMQSLLSGVFAADNEPIYPEVKTASGFSRGLQKVTGFTLLTGWIANRIVHRELNRHVKGDLDSDLKLFSGTDLLRGKARGFSIAGKNVMLDDFISLSEFRFENEKDMPIFVKADKRPFLLRPVQFKVSAMMSEADINRMLQSEKGQKFLTNMKVTMPPFGAQSFDALEPSVDIDGGRLVIRSLMNLHGAPKENALPVTVHGKIAAENSRLSLSDLDLDIEGIEGTDAMAQVIEDYFGELVNLNHIKISRHRVKVAVQTSELKDDGLYLEALLTVEPDKKTLEKYFRK